MKQTFDRFFNRCARILAILDILSSNLSSEGLGKQGFVTGHKMFLHTIRGLRDCVGSKYVYHSKNRISEVFLNDFMCLKFFGSVFQVGSQGYFYPQILFGSVRSSAQETPYRQSTVGNGPFLLQYGPPICCMLASKLY